MASGEYHEYKPFRGRKKMTSRYGAAILFVFKAQRRAHSPAYVTEAATPKTDKRASKVGKVFFDGPLDNEGGMAQPLAISFDVCAARTIN